MVKDDDGLSIQQRARRFWCGRCGARPGEFCANARGGKSYTVHLSRLDQENAAWHQAKAKSDTALIDSEQAEC